MTSLTTGGNFSAKERSLSAAISAFEADEDDWRGISPLSVVRHALSATAAAIAFALLVSFAGRSETDAPPRSQAPPAVQAAVQSLPLPPPVQHMDDHEVFYIVESAERVDALQSGAEKLTPDASRKNANQVVLAAESPVEFDAIQAEIRHMADERERAGSVFTYEVIDLRP
jgi:hypothetical protein